MNLYRLSIKDSIKGHGDYVVDYIYGENEDSAIMSWWNRLNQSWKNSYNNDFNEFKMVVKVRKIK